MDEHSQSSDLARTAALEDLLRHKSLRRYAEALSALKQIISEYPDTLNQKGIWSEIFNAPSWFANSGEDEEYFEYAFEVLVLVLGSLRKMPQSRATACAASFVQQALFRHTVHNQQALLSFMKLRAELFDIALANSAEPRDFNFDSRVSSQPTMRLGVLFKHLQVDPELTSVLPFISGTCSSDTQIVAIVGNGGNDAEKVFHDIPAIYKVISLPQTLNEAIRVIRNENLDLLIFANDITAKPSLAAFLSFYRLARRTAVCVSTIATTASKYVDYYLGSSFHAKMGCQVEFSETFVQVADPGYAFRFNAVDEQVPVFRRDQFADRDTTVLFVSGANHTKLHTDLLVVWCDIMRRVPDSKIVLYPFPPHFGPEQHQVVRRLMSDFEKQGISANRVIILKALPSRNFVVSLLRVMDIGLDSFPYPGVTTMVDAMEARLPTITYLGSTLRSSQGAAVLHCTGLDELITRSVDSYRDLATDLALNPSRLLQLRETLSHARLPFFEHQSFGKTAEAAFKAIYASITDQKEPVG